MNHSLLNSSNRCERVKYAQFLPCWTHTLLYCSGNPNGFPVMKSIKIFSFKHLKIPVTLPHRYYMQCVDDQNSLFHNNSIRKPSAPQLPLLMLLQNGKQINFLSFKKELKSINYRLKNSFFTETITDYRSDWAFQVFYTEIFFLSLFSKFMTF